MPLFPIGDDRNKAVDEASALYEFRLCRRPCKAYGIKVDEICEGGQEVDTSTAPTIDFWTNNSASGSFKYLTELELSPTIPSGVYKVTFRSKLNFELEGPVTIVNSPFNIRYDAFARILNIALLPEWIMTFKRSGWSRREWLPGTGWVGEWLPGETIEFQVTRNHVGEATQTLVFDLCPLDHESKCGGNEVRYQFCLCPLHKINKCVCNYPVKDLHWYILGTPPDTIFTEDWVFTWTNPETCCINWVELFSTLHHKLYVEQNGDVIFSGQRWLPATPSKIYPDNDIRNFSNVYPTLRGDEGFKCDRLRWKLVNITVDEQYYLTWNHGIQHGLVPGERVAVNAEIEDENCEGIQELAFLYIETIGLIGGYVQEVVVDDDITKYIVDIKGKDILLKTTDFTPYEVGDYVAVQKYGMKPVTGYPTVGRWFDSDAGNFRDPVPYITDQNVPKIDVDDGWVKFISEDVIQGGYYDAEYLGSPVIGEEFTASDLVGSNITIMQGKGEGQVRTIIELARSDTVPRLIGEPPALYDLCIVDHKFDPAPNSTSKFKIIDSTVYDPGESLKIVPYTFKNIL